jgi:hypothetical protein
MTPAIRLDRDPPTVCRHNRWERRPDGSFRSGNVVLRNVAGWGPGREEWAIFVVAGSREARVHPASRPWTYGHAGQAKIGVSHMLRAVKAN